MMARPLAEIEAACAGCAKCDLAATRNNLVFGVGNPHANVMFIGEAPGKNEDLKGEPFVGAAGKLLNEMLERVGISRDDIYIANICKCRPPKNRNPRTDEIEACTPWLHEQVASVHPTVIVTLGNFATRFVLNTTEGITGLRGRVHAAGPLRVIPMFHPAAAIYDRSKVDAIAADFDLLKSLLDRDSHLDEHAQEDK